MTRLDGRAAIAQTPPASSCKGHGPGANQTQGGRALDAWRVTGSTATISCHAPAQSVDALSARLVRVRPLGPQLDVQLPGPGLVPRVLLKNASNHPQHFFPAAAPSPEAGEPQRGKNAAALAGTVLASTGEEARLVEDLLGSQQVIHGPTQLGRQDAECFARSVFAVHPRLPTLGLLAGA
jgi:hypothetical protein